MSEKTGISWCDSTVNWWTGCVPVSPGCAHCFSEALAERYGWCEWGKGKPRHKFKGAAKSLAKMNREPWIENHTGKAFSEAELFPGFSPDLYHKRIIFHGDLCDILDPEAPIEWLAEWLDGIRQADQCEHILCTKRPELWFPQFDTLRRMNTKFVTTETRTLIDKWYNGEAPPNITILASVENQEMMDKRGPELLRIPAARRGLSMEPLLGPVSIDPHWLGAGGRSGDNYQQPQIRWVIVGGESGPKARPCNVEWLRDIVQQCKSAGVPCFVKQLGAKVTGRYQPDRVNTWQHPKHRSGADPSEWPEDLRVQEFYK